MNQQNDPAIEVSPIHTAVRRAAQTARISVGSRHVSQIAMAIICIVTTAASVIPARSGAARSS